MIHNAESNLDASEWHQCLVKAIHKHSIVLNGDDEHLVSKHFSKAFHILRNEPIGIRHVLALVIYTDMSGLCTAFRRTYRNCSDQTEKHIIETHTQFYHFARCLFEAVEYFGQEMDSELRVFHGLQAQMKFDKFTAYFNTPISTTKSNDVARTFCQDDGIILALKSGVDTDKFKRPKYISVAWLSSFPQEEEKLFYGAHVVFMIDNIYYIKDSKWKSLSEEVSVFNKLQKLTTNQLSDLRHFTEKDAAVLVPYIQKQLQLHDDTPQQYAESLFSHFCDQP
eukprot:465214_1